MSCEINRDIVRDGIVSTISQMITDMGGSIKDNLVESNDTIIDDINNQFGEEIITENRIVPSNSLIDRYLQTYSEPLYSIKDKMSLTENVLFNMANRLTIPILSKYNGAYYINGEGKMGFDKDLTLEKNTKRLHEFLAWFNLPSDIVTVSKNFTNIDGNKYRAIYSSTDIKMNDETSKKQDKFQAIINFLSEKFDYKDNVVITTKADFYRQFPSQPKNIESAIINGKIYIFKTASNDIVAEELLHPFVTALMHSNSALFSNLIKLAKKEFPQIAQEVFKNYRDRENHIQQQELVTKTLARVFSEGYEEGNKKESKNLLQQAFDWIKDVMNEMVNYFVVDYGKFPTNLTFNDLVDILNISDTYFTTEFISEPLHAKRPDSLYDIIYNYVSDAGIRDKVTEVMDKLPKVINTIKSKLSKEEYGKITELMTQLDGISDEKEELITQLSMIMNVSRTLLDLDKQVDAIGKNTEMDDNTRLAALYALNKAIDSFSEFSPILIELDNLIKTEIGKPENLKNFYRQIDGAISTPIKIKSSIINKTSSSLINIITDYHSDYITPELKRINDRIEELRNEPVRDIQRSKVVDELIKRLQKDKEMYPTRGTIVKIFEGKFDDASKISMFIEAFITNGHPLVSGLASMINDIDIEISKEIIESTNNQQKQIDLLSKATGKGLRDQNNRHVPIMDTFQRVQKIIEKVQDDGSIKYEPLYVSQKGLLSHYSTEYTKKFEEWQAYEDFYKFKIYSLKNDKQVNGPEIEKLKKAWSDVLNEKKEFIKENSERKYLPEIYDMWDILDKPIQIEDGTTATIRELRGDYQNKIHIEQELLEDNYESEGRQAIYNYLESLVREMKEMRNKFDKNGKEKTGSDLDIANTIQEYYDKQRKYGTFELTEGMKGVFEADLSILKNKLIIGDISQEEYDRQHSLIANDEVAPEFFQQLLEYSNQVSEYADILSNIPELAPFLISTKQIMKDNFSKLRDVTKAFRDEDGKIDGISFENERPEVQKNIKSIQEAYEKLKSEADKLKGLSIADNIRMNKLSAQKASGTITPQEQDELRNLLQSKKDNNILYNKYKEEIDNYLNAVKELAGLSTSSTTKYYDEQINEIANNLQVSDEVKKQIEDTLKKDQFTIGSINFVLNNGKWSTQNLTNFIPLSNTTDGSAEVSKMLANDLARKMLKNSDWWLANHYKSYQWNQSSYKYEQVEKPIYIWIEQKPKREEYIKIDQPAFKYKRYTIKNEYINPDYKYLMGYIPQPKPGKFINERYEKLKASTSTSDKAYFSFLENQREYKRKIEESMPQSKKLGDVLPSIIKTHGENLVENTQNFKENVGRIFSTNFKSSENEDDAFLLHGSMKNTQNHEIPLRFVGKMDGSNQSSDIPGMLLIYELSTKKWEKLTNFEPFVKSLQDIASKLKVTETSRRGAKPSFRNFIKAVTGNLQEETHEKETNKTVLSETIDNMINMWVYGKTSQEAIINIGGFDWDMNKVSSNLMGFASKSLFILNAFPAAKNTLSTSIQSLINSNTEQGYYSSVDYMWGQAKSVSYSQDYIHDFSRVGDKSFIGQFADYHSVLSGSPINEFGKKTQFTLMKEKGELLSGLKAFSEFNAQMVQMLAVAKSTKVKLNGELVPILYAYELDKNRNFRLKDGAEVSKLDELRFTRLVQRINADVAGRYRELEKTYLETFVIGKLAMYMNRYFVPMWQNRYAGKRYSAETGTISSGYAYESISLLKDSIFLYQGRLSEQWKDMSPRERANVMKFIKDLGTLIALSVVISLMGGGDDKKHLKQNLPLYNYMLGLAIGVNTETQSFIDYTDLIRKAQSPFMAITLLKQMAKVLSLVPQTMLDSDSAYYTHGTGIKDGLHDKGDRKLTAQFLKFLGWTGVQFQPDELVKRQNAITQLR